MKEIISKYFNGRASADEQKQILAWLRKKTNRKAFNSYKLDWRKGRKDQQLPEGSEKSWLAIQDQMLQKSYTGWQRSIRSNQLLRIAAIFFFVIGLAGVFYTLQKSMPRQNELFTTVVAENGQVSKVMLPDGSLVWLNSGSEMKYSNLFGHKNRNIEMIGEAFFDVTHNADLPLLVNSNELCVKVLGTRFNVMAYPDCKTIEVVLEQGKIELTNSEVASFQYVMHPGERATFHKECRSLVTADVNTQKFTSWKNGMVNIYDLPMGEVLGRLEKRYNQQFEYDRKLEKYHFTFTIKNEQLDEIIGIMEKIAPIRAEQKGDVIVIKTDELKLRELSR